MVTIAVANCLGFPPGVVTINITNAHIYEDHSGGKVWEMRAFSMPTFTSWSKYVNWAKATIEFRPIRKELEHMFFVREVKIK
jgi:thymidylate synthase